MNARAFNPRCRSSRILPRHEVIQQRGFLASSTESRLQDVLYQLSKQSAAETLALGNIFDTLRASAGASRVDDVQAIQQILAEPDPFNLCLSGCVGEARIRTCRSAD